jgi:hypothetical protein
MLYSVNGYWKDDKDDNFEGYIISSFNDVPENENDDNIFFYGMSEKEIQEAIELGNNSFNDFVLTAYEKI